jgi:hypothetical protein
VPLVFGPQFHRASVMHLVFLFRNPGAVARAPKIERSRAKLGLASRADSWITARHLASAKAERANGLKLAFSVRHIIPRPTLDTRVFFLKRTDRAT